MESTNQDPHNHEAVSRKDQDVKEEHEEYQYLDLIKEIINSGEHRPDRTGTGTYSIFAPRPL
ncbi:hypothetical protein K3495_g17105, partial [Podosphaera aphanis]